MTIKFLPKLCLRNSSVCRLIGLNIHVWQKLGKNCLCHILWINTAGLILYIWLVNYHIDQNLRVINRGKSDKGNHVFTISTGEFLRSSCFTA